MVTMGLAGSVNNLGWNPSSVSAGCLALGKQFLYISAFSIKMEIMIAYICRLHHMCSVILRIVVRRK